MYIYCSTYGKTELPGHSVTPRWFHQDALTARSPSSCPAKLILAIHLFLKRPRKGPEWLGKRSGWNGTNIFQECFIGIIFKSLSDCAKGSVFQVRFPGNYYVWPERTSKWHGSWGQKLDRSPATGHTRMGRLGRAFSSSLMQLGFRAMEHSVPSSVAP